VERFTPVFVGKSDDCKKYEKTVENFGIIRESKGAGEKRR